MEQGTLEISDDSDQSPVLRLELPWPPSANHYVAYRVVLPSFGFFKDLWNEHGGDLEQVYAALRKKSFVQAYPTKVAKEFKDNVQRIVWRDFAGKKWHGPLAMRVRTYPPDRRKRDTSNLLKCLEDALQDSGVFMDDYQIVEHHLCRTSTVVSGGMVVVELKPTVLF